MVPIDALTGDLSVFKLHNHDYGNFDPFARRRYAGENPRHLDRVGKLVNQFVHYAVISNRASDRQWNDIVKLIETLGEEFGSEEFLRWAEELGLAELAQEALAEAGGLAHGP